MFANKGFTYLKDIHSYAVRVNVFQDATQSQKMVPEAN